MHSLIVLLIVLIVIIVGVIAALGGLWLFGERGRLLRPSTRRMMRAMGRWSVLSKRFWHAYVYGRWSNQYIGWSIRHVFPRVKPDPANRLWAEQYHGKIVTTAQARALITVNEPINCPDLEQIIPYATARTLVLAGPPDIAVYECPCRAARPNPCQPTQVCMIVGQPFVDFILEHNPRTSRRLSQAEAVELLDAERARGHLHAAYFKDVMLNRFYAICNCCACCCGGLEAMNRLGVPMVTSSGYVAHFDEMVCQGCATCADTCPFDAIEVDGTARLIWEKCMGCGVCASQCPNQAITLVLDGRKGQPLDVEQLLAQAARG